MNIVETLLVFVGAPLGLALILTALVFGRTALQQHRYRPGRAWTYAPVWYVPHPDRPVAIAPVRPAGRALAAGSGPRFVDADHPAAPGTFGGATGEW